MRKDDTTYTIHIIWDDINYEFKATFDSYDRAPDSGMNTYGCGDSKSMAVINLLEGANKLELEE